MSPSPPYTLRQPSALAYIRRKRARGLTTTRDVDEYGFPYSSLSLFLQTHDRMSKAVLPRAVGAGTMHFGNNVTF